MKPQKNIWEVPNSSFLPSKFNKKKFNIVYPSTTNKCFLELQNIARNQCLNKKEWIEIDKINGWMVSAETATFMKWGGLGVIATELPEAFNTTFADSRETLTIVTPIYQGNTGKKSCQFSDNLYIGAEHRQINLTQIATIEVPFMGSKDSLVDYKVKVYKGFFENCNYIFLENERFFNIDPHRNNPPAQDGCYIMNKHGINEVERFAFFSKAVFELLKFVATEQPSELPMPNVVIANDWHSGALSGLLKYFTTALVANNKMSSELAQTLRKLPVVHIAHHLGYQGWDYDNTSKILNSLYEKETVTILKNAKSIKNSNPRATNTLIVHDCYNQASCNFHLADRLVTVSKNYMEEVSKELGLGFDFRDILKIRKDHRNFFGIVNGYDKRLISPNQNKIDSVNNYFGNTDFKTFDENSIEIKQHNKQEFIKLLSKIATDDTYKQKVIPLIDTYKFEDLSHIKDIKNTPVICATSRLVEQKGYDIAAQAVLNIAKKYKDKSFNYPIIIMGGAGDINYFKMLTELKDKIAVFSPEIAAHIFIFRGYKDEFAYAIQLAADFYMMPSRFEPCGLTQMEAMAKGALPIATSTGGLVDTIEDKVDGFRTEVFFADNRRVYGNNLTAQRLKTNENAYSETLENAINIFYQTPQTIIKMQKNAMHKDFSWSVKDGSVFKYHKLLKTGNL